MRCSTLLSATVVAVVLGLVATNARADGTCEQKVKDYCIKCTINLGDGSDKFVIEDWRAIQRREFTLTGKNYDFCPNMLPGRSRLAIKLVAGLIGGRTDENPKIVVALISGCAERVPTMELQGNENNNTASSSVQHRFAVPHNVTCGVRLEVHEALPPKERTTEPTAVRGVLAMPGSQILVESIDIGRRASGARR